MTTPTEGERKKAEEIWNRIVSQGKTGDEMAMEWIATALSKKDAEISRLRDELKKFEPHVHDIKNHSCGCCASCVCGFGYGGTHGRR